MYIADTYFIPLGDAVFWTVNW